MGQKLVHEVLTLSIPDLGGGNWIENKGQRAPRILSLLQASQEGQGSWSFMSLEWWSLCGWVGGLLIFVLID